MDLRMKFVTPDQLVLVQLEPSHNGGKSDAQQLSGFVSIPSGSAVLVMVGVPNALGSALPVRV